MLVFGNEVFDREKIFQDIQFFTWFWLKNLMKVDVVSFLPWQIQTNLCLKQLTPGSSLTPPLIE